MGALFRAAADVVIDAFMFLFRKAKPQSEQKNRPLLPIDAKDQTHIGFASQVPTAFEFVATVSLKRRFNEPFRLIFRIQDDGPFGLFVLKPELFPAIRVGDAGPDP